MMQSNNRENNTVTTSADAIRENYKHPSTVNGADIPRLRIQLKNEINDRNKKTRNELKDALLPQTQPQHQSNPTQHYFSVNLRHAPEVMHAMQDS